MDPLHYRILELAYALKLSHIGSALTCVNILDSIYTQRAHDEPVCLGEGHASLAQYVCLEKHAGADAKELAVRQGVHAHRDLNDGIHVSCGSLGQVETVAMGLALANADRRVWLVSSDGGAAEGAFWETLRCKRDLQVTNLRWFINANGYGAYRAIDVAALRRAIHAVDDSVMVCDTSATPLPPFLVGLDAHYHAMTSADWAWVETNS